MPNEDVEGLGGYRRDTIDHRFERVDDRLRRLEQRLDGPPSQDDRVKEMIADKHRDVMTFLQLKLDPIEDDGKEARKEIGELKKYVWMGVGGLAALELIFKLVGK